MNTIRHYPGLARHQVLVAWAGVIAEESLEMDKRGVPSILSPGLGLGGNKWQLD